MKTSNKLLLGLIIVIMVLTAITVVMTHHSDYTEFKQNKEEASTEYNLSQDKTIVSVMLFSPIIFLQLPR